MTTIHVPDGLKKRLGAHRLHRRETYADVVERALDVVEEDELELSPGFREKVKRARKDASAGRTLSTEELIRDLGL